MPLRVATTKARRNMVTRINAVTGKALRPVKVGRGPGQVVVSPNGKTAYVATSRGVVPVSTATGTAGKAIKGLGSPIAITP
jgi:DNA-binding beta-propeller fold protein YncE